MMECNLTQLFNKFEQYVLKYIELFKYKTISIVSELMSDILTSFAIIFLCLFCIFFLNVALALWIGDIVGKNYLGFLIVAGIYALTIILISSILPYFRKNVKNNLISYLTNL